NRAFRRFAADGTEEIDRDDLRQSLTQAGDLGANIGERRSLCVGTQRLRQSARVLDHLCVVGIAGLVEQRADLLVGEAVDQARLADEAFTPSFSNFSPHPLQLLL